MKNKLLGLAICILSTSTLFAQNKKVGIINFSIHGHQHAMGATSDIEPDLYFIGDGTAELSPGVRVSDEIVRYTEEALKTFLGYDILATNLERASTVPAQTMGRLWVMETITEKKAFKQLGYDEVIEVECRIGSAGKSGKYYKPFIEVFIKIKDKDGKTIFKKREKLKLNDKIPASQVEETKGSGLTISFSKKDEQDGGGIPAAQLLDWYKQVLGNLLVQ